MESGDQIPSFPVESPASASPRAAARCKPSARTWNQRGISVGLVLFLGFLGFHRASWNNSIGICRSNSIFLDLMGFWKGFVREFYCLSPFLFLAKKHHPISPKTVEGLPNKFWDFTSMETLAWEWDWTENMLNVLIILMYQRLPSRILAF